MKGREVVKQILDNQGVGITDYAARLGISKQTAWNRVNSSNVKDIPLSLLADMLQVLDYKIMVVPRKTRCPEDGFEVDGKASAPKPEKKPAAPDLKDATPEQLAQINMILYGNPDGEVK